MNTCKECIHAEMCKWIDELEGRGCDFFDGEQEPCEKSMNKAYEFGNHKGVGVYWNTETNTVELPKAVFEYILRQVPSRKDNIECEWAKMTYDTDNKENKIMFEFSDGTKKRVTYTEEIKRTTVGE